MTEIRLDEYYSAGYFLIRKNTAPFWLNNPETLVPTEIISLETEFCEKFSVSLGWGNDNKDEALEFGVIEEKWEAFQAWCNNHHIRKDIDVWSMFHTVKVARSFIHEFISKSTWDGLILVGAGLNSSCIAEWMELAEPPTEGVEYRLQQHLTMETGGQVLGFDIASYAHHNFDHTWFSHHHHQGVFKDHGIRPGAFGLLGTKEEAQIARNYTNEHDGYYYDYWLLVSYPLEINGLDNNS